MTNLPRKPLPRSTVVIEGQAVEVRGLSRSEALHLNTAFRDGTPTGDVAGAEVYILVKGTGVSEDEAKAFRDENDPATAGLLIDEVLALSGLSEVMPDGKAPDPKPRGSGRS